MKDVACSSLGKLAECNASIPAHQLQKFAIPRKHQFEIFAPNSQGSTSNLNNRLESYALKRERWPGGCNALAAYSAELNALPILHGSDQRDHPGFNKIEMLGTAGRPAEHFSSGQMDAFEKWP